MKNIFKITFASAVFTALGAFGADALSTGNRAFFAGDYRNAVRCYEDHLKKSAAAKDQESWIKGVQNLGVAYIHNGDTGKARELFDRFRAQYPDRSSGVFEGMLLAAEGRYAEAEKLLLSLKTADPESDDARLFVLATVFMQTGRLLPAYQLFAEVSGTIGKTYSPYAVSDAVEALKSGKMNEAQQLIGRLAARAESPWKFFAASESVYALIRLNRLDEAFTVLAEIPRDRYTFNTELLQYLAEAHRGEVGNFKKNYTVFLEKMPRQISLRILELFTAAADAAAKSGDHQFAAVLLRNAINSTENTALKQKFARQLIASLSIADPDAAVTEIAGYFTIHSADPEKTVLAMNTASVLYHRKAFAAAMKLYGFIWEKTQDLQALKNAVDCAETIPDFAALEKFNQVLFAKVPAELIFRLRYAAFLEKHGRFEAAEAQLLAAIGTAEKLKDTKNADKFKFLAMEFYLRRDNAEKIRLAAEKLEKSADKNYISAAKFEIGELLEKEGLFSRAKRYFTETESLGVPEFAPQASFKAALMSYSECSFEVAAGEFFSCAGQYPDYEKASEALFMAYSLFELTGENDKAAEADRIMRQKYAASPAFAVLILNQAAKNARNMPVEKLLADLESVEKNFPGSSYAAEAALLRGIFTGRSGKSKEALKILQKLYTHEDKAVAAESLLRSGEILFGEYKFTEAGELFRQSAAANPGTQSSDIAVLRAMDCILADKSVPERQKQLELCIGTLSELAGKSRFPLIRLEAAYKAAVAMKAAGKNSEAAGAFEKNIYLAADMYEQGIAIGSIWCIKSCEAALEMINPGDRGALAGGIRLIEVCEKILPDQDLSRMKQNFRDKISKKRR